METLNHGILRFNDECTLKIDFDQSTNDMTMTRINDVTGEETVISGGGESGSLEFIKTETIDTDKHEVLIDISNLKNEYGLIIIKANMTFSAADWFYAKYTSENSAAPFGDYSPKLQNLNMVWLYSNIGDHECLLGGRYMKTVVKSIDVKKVGGYCSTDGVNILAGTQFDIYGIKYTVE